MDVFAVVCLELCLLGMCVGQCCMKKVTACQGCSCFCIRLCQVYSIKADKKADRYLCELLWFTCKVLSAMKWMPGISRRASSYSAVRYLPSSLSSSMLRYDWYRDGAISPFSRACNTAQPGSWVWVQLPYLQSFDSSKNSTK